MTTSLAIADAQVRTVGNLYSLNDLHRASGGLLHHQPAKFMALVQTKALITELVKSPDSEISKSVRGNGGGTYACKELVIAYAAWISAVFHLKVIRVFLVQQAQAAAPLVLGRRYLVRVDGAGKEQVQPIDPAAYVLTATQIVAAVKQGAFGAAVNRELAQIVLHDKPAADFEELVSALKPADRRLWLAYTYGFCCARKARRVTK